jgi:hypothetical protein
MEEKRKEREGRKEKKKEVKRKEGRRKGRKLKKEGKRKGRKEERTVGEGTSRFFFLLFQSCVSKYNISRFVDRIGPRLYSSSTTSVTTR